jgi:single-strand DNA-binding protein
MNSYNAIGRLTKDPDFKTTGTGISICNITLAVDTGKDQQGQSTAAFIECTAFKKTAEVLMQYVKKGRQIGVSGSIVQENWVDKTTGQNRSKLKVNINNITLISDGQKQQPQQQQFQQQPQQQQQQWQNRQTQQQPQQQVISQNWDLSDDDLPF